MNKINLEYIKTFDPCQDGLDNYIKYHKEFNGTMTEFLSLEHIPYEDKVWLLVKVIDYKILQQWSVDCAESVLHIYEDRYPGDNRVRDCIETTKKYLVGECSIEEVDAAGAAAAAAAWSAGYDADAADAADAAWAARYAAGSARYAASAARSVDVARSARAAWSADAAADAAESAAWSAAADAAGSVDAARSARFAAVKEQENINLSLLIALLQE